MPALDWTDRPLAQPAPRGLQPEDAEVKRRRLEPRPQCLRPKQAGLGEGLPSPPWGPALGGPWTPPCGHPQAAPGFSIGPLPGFLRPRRHLPPFLGLSGPGLFIQLWPGNGPHSDSQEQLSVKGGNWKSPGAGGLGGEMQAWRPGASGDRCHRLGTGPTHKGRPWGCPYPDSG